MGSPAASALVVATLEVVGDGTALFFIIAASQLYRHLRTFVDYYHRNRVHLAWEKDTPEPRPIQPPESGRIVSIPVLGGLHHRYERRAA